MQAINEKEYERLVNEIQKEVKELQKSSGWELFVDSKVKGYKKKSQTNSITLKSEIIVNLPLEKVTGFFQREDAMQKLNDMVIQNKVLYEKKGSYRIYHLQIKTPFPMDNRETITISTWMKEINKFYMGAKSCDYPIGPTPKFVMSHLNIGGWIFEQVGLNSTNVTNISDMDPKGSVPDFLKDMMASKRVEGISNLEAIIKKHSG